MEDWKYQKARKRVRKVKGFYKHLGTWVVFGVFFVVLNMVTDPGEFWAIFPIMGWGVGVAIHAIGTFGFPGMGDDWEERLMQREIDRLAREEEDRNQASKRALPPSSAQQLDPLDEDMELKELRRESPDSDFV
jgi:hypothetical protein